MRKPLKLAGVPQTGKPISAASGLKFTILWGHLEAILLLNKFCSARFRPASEIRTKATPCVEVWQTSNLRRLRLGEEKKKRKRKKEEKETTG